VRFSRLCDVLAFDAVQSCSWSSTFLSSGVPRCIPPKRWKPPTGLHALKHIRSRSKTVNKAERAHRHRGSRRVLNTAVASTPASQGQRLCGPVPSHYHHALFDYLTFSRLPAAWISPQKTFPNHGFSYSLTTHVTLHWPTQTDRGSDSNTKTDARARHSLRIEVCNVGLNLIK
jgi:hypothetical protein